MCRVLMGIAIAAMFAAPSIAAGETWEGGYGSADAACRAKIDESGAFMYSRVEIKGNIGHCYTKAKDGEGEESYVSAVMRDETPEEGKEASSSDSSEDPSPPPAEAAAKDQKGGSDCSKLQALEGDKLKKEVIARLKKIVVLVNQEFAKKPAIAMEVVSEAEIVGVSYTFGAKQTKSGQSISDASLNILYGHILERLTGKRFAQYDPCLPTYLEYIPNVIQMQTPGGSPDFKGLDKASGLQPDITTAGEATKKKAQGKNYDFILYTRLLKIDDAGHAVLMK
jgi:hypothetical protein